MKKLLFSLLVAVLATFALPLLAQNWEFGLGLNAVNYQGDLVKTSLFNLKETQPGGTIFARHNFAGDKLALRLGLNLGRISGDDVNYTDRTTRKFNFKSPLTEIAATLEWAPLSTKGKFAPYFFGGLGVALTNPTVSFNESSAAVAYAKAGIAKDKTDLKKTALAIPLGVGFKIPTAKGTLGLEFGVRMTTSDYLDGISEAANPNKKDMYFIGGINYAFRLGGGESKVTEKVKKVSAKDKLLAEQALKEKDAADKIRREREAREQEIRDKELAEREAADKILREKQAAAKAIADRDAADKAMKAKELADKARMEKEAADKAMREKDSDGDGVADYVDKCPNTKGSPSNEGCPVLSTTDTKTITEAISNITFKTSSSEFTGESLSILKKVADVLKRNPNYNVSIEGHTDNQGKDNANLALSKSRAKSCMNYLASKGISASRMTSEGYGETRPVTANDTEVNRRKNRRVEFILSVK